jgi:tRNA(Ile)-lysidine synthase
MILEGEKLWVAAWEAELPPGTFAGQLWPALSQGAEMRLAVPGKISLEHGWEFRAELVTDHQIRSERVWGNEDPYMACLDAASVEIPLLIRSRQPGERIKPLGMGGHSIKISDLMINAHLPVRARRAWPLVVSGHEIAWVPGLRLAHPFRVTNETQVGIRLVLSRQD